MKRFLLAAFAVFFVLSMVNALAATLTINWSAPSLCADGSALTNCPLTKYTLYSGLSGTPKTVLATTAANVTTFAALNTGPGNWCVQISASSAAGESALTNEVCKVIAAPLPAPPSGITVTVTVQTADTNAYKLRQSVDGAELVAFGTLPVGTICNASHALDGMNLVPRSFVAMFSKLDTQPLEAWAHCS